MYDRVQVHCVKFVLISDFYIAKSLATDHKCTGESNLQSIKSNMISSR